MDNISDEYFISFDTRINPGKIQAIRVRLDIITTDDHNKTFNINLCKHPLYRDLVRYVKDNPL